MKHFPIGAIVLIDGVVRARVLEACPEGTTSQLSPHYRVDIEHGDRNVRVSMNRIGVTKKLRSE